MADKITQVYNAYKADGATRAKSEQQFRNWMYGDNYRRGVWNDLRKQGANVGTFEHFTEALGYKMNPKVKSKVAKQAIQYGAPKVPDNWGQITSNNILGSFANDKTFTPTLKKKNTPALMFRESELGGGWVLDYGKKDPKTGEVSIELERKMRDDSDREAQKLNQQIIESLSEETEARARKKQRETIRKEMGYASTDANEGMGALFGGIRRANIEHGTENEYVDAYLKAMNTPEFKSKIEEAAKKAGVDPEYLYNNHVLPRAKEDIRNHLIESGTPKSTADYIMQGALDGIAGNMFKRGLMTADQRTIMDEATAKKAEQIDDERKKNGFFSTATLTSAGRTAMGMAADAAAFAGAGKIAGGIMSGLSYGVNLITKTPLGKRLFGSVIGTSAKALEKKFGAEGAARIANFVGNNNGFWKTLLTTGSKNTMQSGLTLANYNVMQYMTGEGYDKMEKGTTFADYIIGMVDAGNSGFKTGLLFGAVGSVGGTLGRNVGITGTEANMIERLKHGVRKAAVKTGTFVAESLAFRTEQMAEEWAKDNKINFVDNFVEGALENLSIKLGSAMGGGKVAHFSPSRIMRGLVFAEGNSGLKLTKEERSEFMSNTKAKSLLEACEALEPNHKTQGEGLTMEVSTPANGQSAYEARQETANKKQIDLSERTPGGQALGKLQQFLDDKTISWTLRQKVAAALGGTMSNSRPRTDRVSVTENGGKFSVSEYSKDGELLSSKEYNDKDGAEAAKQEIYLKRQDRDFKNAYLSAMRISTEGERQECIEKVAEELGYKSAAEMLLESARRSEEGNSDLDKEIGDAYKRIAEQMEGAKAKRVLDIQREVGEEFGVDLDKAMDKDYSKRSSVEEQAIEEFKKRLTGLSEDKNDMEQRTTTASQEGSDLAEQTDIEDSTDFTEKAQAVNDRQASARAAWDELVKANPDLEEWMKSNPDFDISDLRENFGDAVADTWAEVHAADSMKAGFVDHVGQSIEDAVKKQVVHANFAGTMQDKEGIKVVTDNSVTVFADKDGNEYTLVGGDVIVDSAGDGSYSVGKSGLVIFRDKDGNLVQRTNFDGLNEVGTFSLEDYANRIRKALQEQKTAEIQSTEQPKVETPKEEAPKGKTIIESVEPEEKPTAKEEPKKGESPKYETPKTEVPANEMPKMPETPKEETPKENQSESENEPPKAEGPQPSAEPKEESNYEKNDIPMDSEGEPIYEQVPKERTAQDLFDKLGDGNVAHDYAQIRIEGAEKELKEAKKKEPKIGAKINEYLKKKQEYEDRVKAAEDKVNYWGSVKDEIEKLTHTTPEELKEAQEELDGTAAREEYKKTVSETQPADGVSLAAEFVVDARITPESFRKETGLGAADQRTFVGMIASAEKGGKSIERLGEELVVYDNTYYGGAYFHGDSNDARSAIISALMSARSRKGLREMAQPDMEREVRERARMRDEAYHERYGMDYEEYLSYSEQEMPHILGKLNNFDEQKYLQDKAEEITNQINKEHGKADRENDSSREESVHGAGDKVLPEERIDDRGRGESPKEHGGREKAERRGNTEDAPLQETPSGGEVEKGERKEEKPSDPSDAAEGMRGAAEQFHEERVEKARKAYEEAKASGDASETKRTKDEYRKALDDKLKAQGIGLIERRKTIAKEMGEEPKVEKPKGEGPKVGEKQWEDMTPMERAEKADADPLTEDEIRSDEDNKELAAAAIAYLNGDKSLLNQIAYLKIYGNVRSRHEDVPGNSGTEDKTQLAATDNGGGEGMELESGRGSGGTVEPMDRGAGGEAAPGKQEGGETGKGDTDSPAGEGSHSEGEGGTSGLGGLPAGSGGRTGGGTAGSTGSVGSGRGRGSGSRPSKSNGKRKPAAKQGTSFPNSKGRDVRQETKDAKAAMMAAFAEFKKRGKKGSVSISLVGLNNEQIEYLPEMAKATGRYGVALIGEGIYRAKEWIRNVREAITDQMKDCGFSDTDIDEYIREMWHMPWEMDGETHKIGEWASIKGYAGLRESLKEPLRKKFDKQVLAEPTEVKVGDRKNIEETLPFLLPQQQDDVLKAETQFFDESHKDKAHAGGKGYMFTNGTGTGKTYTGLGIIKRMVKQGKGRILIITPSQQKVKDWINDGKNLCLDIRDLDDWANERGNTATNEKGDGVVITTFANFGTNKRLLEDQFDAIVYDESHRIMENKNATETARSRQHYMLSNRNESYALMRLEEINPDCMKMRGLAEDFEDARKKEVERIQAEYRKEHPSENEKEMRFHTSKSLPKDIHSFSISDKEKFTELGKIYEDYIKARDYYINNVKPKLEKQAKESVDKTKVVFLSATPFNTRENIEYAEGYLFSYPERNDMGQSGKTQFFLEHFGAGYKYRYHRLESSTSNAEALAKQEIAFSDWLQNDLGTMSGRVIDSPFDYSRDFPTVSVEHADEFNTACEEISRDKIFGDAYRKVLGDYNYGSALFETMKVSALLPRLREHLAAGRKIVIFHRRVTSKEPLKAPFGMILGEQAEQTIKALPKEKQPEARIHLNELRDKYSELLEWEKTLDFSMPREQLAKAFGEDNILYFSGSESKSVKSEAVKQFNDDNSGKNIIVIQEASGKEGISLHDTTGKHQRVCITLALPQSPITALQIEGRTYRIGNESNAIFEYPVLGLTSEYNLFASKFNRQVSTTENLALGNQARNLRDSFARGIEEHSGIVPIDQQGVGGKEFDKGDVSENDPFDNAVLDYYTNQRLNKNNRKGVDYFPTPEPLGYKMVEWANIGEGDSVLEPSAGHGAIARYVPQSNELVAIEPSMSLFAKLQMKAGGLGRKFQNETFEAYHISNKHDTIVMNPPFGHAGATAIAHIEKAFGHLEEGGRMVAIIPRGAMDKKFDKWYDNEKTAAMRAEVDLPDIAFQQAGTSVRCRVVVVDKITDSKLREQAHMEKSDLSGHYDKIEDFFNDLRGVEVPDRIIDTNFKMQKMSKSAVKSLKEIRDVWSADVDKDGVHVRTSSWMGYDISFTGSEDPKRWKDKMAATYDKYAQMEKSELREGNKAVFGELKELACKLAGMTEDEMRRYLVSKGTGGVRFRTSDELFKEYGPRWIDEQTNEDGRHTTQVKNTINSYKKFGEFVKEDSKGRDVDVLDASSGLGLGTEWMRENGMNVDDVEPFPSKNRTAPTYTKYDDVKKKYDYIISNAVLNVIPDDWRANVLHDMADKLKVGGKLVINVRGAQSIKTQGTEGKTRTTLDDPSEILVHRPDGSIKAYQKGFTKEELRDWCKQELGEDYSVEIANKKNAGGSYDTAVVVKKEKEGTRFRKGEDLTPEERRAEKRMEEHHVEVAKAAKNLNTKVNVCVDINDVTNAEARAAIERGEKVKAWYDTRTGEVHVYLPNVTDKYDAQMSVAHEVVAHKGMRGLLGEEGYRSMMRRMYTHLSNEEVKEVNERMMRNGWDFYTAMDEWVADKAEESVFTPKYVVMKDGLHRYPLDKVFHIVTEALHNVGYRINPNVDDVKYWLWESKKGLKNGDAYTAMKRNSFLWRLNHNTSNDGIENGEFVKTGSNNMSDEQSREAVLFRKQSLDRSKNDTPLMSSTKDSIDKALNNWNARRIECFTDDKHGLRVFQQELAKGLKKGMNDSMDSYHGAINQSSIVREKQYQFETRELKAMNDAVKECTRKLGGGMEGYEELNKYAYVKSGLERNRVLFVRDAAEQVDKKIMKLNKEALDKDPQAATLAKMGVEEFRDAFHSEKKFQETLLNSGKISLAEYYKALDDFIKDFSFQHTGDAEKDALIDKLNDWYADKIGGKYDENENDYSGIRKFDDFNSDAERIDYVMNTEAILGEESKNKLWRGIGGVTHFAIDNDYNYGVISKDVHNRVSSMFSWYIPMRGFKEDTMEDMYAYLNNEISDGGNVSSVVKRADGRTTLADSPLGTAAALAERSISNGEDNRNKQRLYRLVNQWLKDHTTANEDGKIELTEEAPAMISEVWYKKVTDHTTGEVYWEAVMPDIDGEKDPKQIRAKVERFEENMRNAEKNGNATRTLQKGTFAKPFNVAKHKNEHVVFVNVNGKQKMIIMQGNPRPAQAINGDTASDVTAGRLMRGMSAMFTSYNITFSVTNTSRDTFFANNNVAIREDAAYYARFVKNQALMGGSMLQGTVMMNMPKVKGMYYQLWSDYKKGRKLTGKYGKYFEEYMNNGGKTGFVQTKTIEDLEKHIRNEATQKMLSASTLGKVMSKVPEVIEALNERSENMNRFACYVTSREMGRSVMRSVSDAKEVSTNFNRKGSGSKAFKGTNAKAWEKWQGWLYDRAKSYYLFFNAGMQSLSLLSNNLSRHPVKTAAFAVGIPILFASSIIPAINSWIASCCDEDDQYDNLSEWERRNNICIYAGHSNWVKVPLPIELRAFYGFGDIALGVTNPAFRSEKGLWLDMLSQMTQILPLDFMGEGGDVIGSLIPDIVKPLYHVMVNRDWTGKPIYKDYDYLKYEPEYQKVFQGENEWFVSFSKFINEMSGGNEHVKGSLDGKWNNPAIWGEIINGYGGGALSDAIRTGKLATRVATWNWEDFSTREVPMARALYSSATEKTKYYRSLSKYAHYKEDADKYLHDFKANLKSDNPLYVMKAISDMKRESPEFVRMVKIHGFEKSIKDLKKIANNERIPKKARDEAKELINQEKVKLVKEFESDE